MPYIRQDRREEARFNPQTEGELNYAFCMMIKTYIENSGMCYRTCNDIMGALSGADKEFYRKVVVPYEETKIHENGDVW